VSITTVSSSLGYVRGDSVRAVAVSAAERTPLMPSTPAIGETVPGYAAGTWHGVLAPAGTPPATVAALNAAFNECLRLPEVAEKLRGAQGADIVGGAPEVFGRFVAAEIAKWGPVVRDAGIRADA
jgi:tripartite-type tricarboxylate transporter receptor subunit TctC